MRLGWERSEVPRGCASRRVHLFYPFDGQCFVAQSEVPFATTMTRRASWLLLMFIFRRQERQHFQGLLEDLRHLQAQEVRIR